MPAGRREGAQGIPQNAGFLALGSVPCGFVLGKSGSSPALQGEARGPERSRDSPLDINRLLQVAQGSGAGVTGAHTGPSTTGEPAPKLSCCGHLPPRLVTWGQTCFVFTSLTH